MYGFAVSIALLFGAAIHRASAQAFTCACPATTSSSSSSSSSSSISTSTVYVTVVTSSTSSSTSITTSSSSSSLSLKSTSSTALPAPTGPIFYPGNTNYGLVGCYTEPQPNRLLSNVYTDKALTAESCLAFAAAGGYQYAGLEYQQECWYGNTLNPAGTKAASSASCAKVCLGNAFEYCGAGQFLVLYQKGAVVVASSVQSTSSTSSSSSVIVVSTTSSSSSSAQPSSPSSSATPSSPSSSIVPSTPSSSNSIPPSTPSGACVIPVTAPSNSILTGFAIQVQNASYPAVDKTLMNLEPAGGGDMHFFLAPVGNPINSFTLVSGVLTLIQPGLDDLHAVIGGEYDPLENTTKEFMTARGDPRAVYNVAYTCINGFLQKQLVFASYGVLPGGTPGGNNCVRVASGNRGYEFRYSPPGNMGPNLGECITVALIVEQ